MLLFGWSTMKNLPLRCKPAHILCSRCDHIRPDSIPVKTTAVEPKTIQEPAKCSNHNQRITTTFANTYRMEYLITEATLEERKELSDAEFSAVLTNQGSKKIIESLLFPPAFVRSYEGLGFFPSWVVKVTPIINSRKFTSYATTNDKRTEENGKQPQEQMKSNDDAYTPTESTSSSSCMINYHENQPHHVYISTVKPIIDLPKILEAFKLTEKDVKLSKITTTQLCPLSKSKTQPFQTRRKCTCCFLKSIKRY